MRFVLAAALLTTTIAVAAEPGADPQAGPAAPPAAMPGLLGAAVTAADESRYCDALFLFEALHLRQPSPRAIYNAAEVAFAAGDRVRALDLYRTTQTLYPDFEKKDLIQQRADAVFAAMVKAGPGTACPVRVDSCGDWMLRPVKGGEQCDDGNRVDGDGCDANCTITTCGNGVVTTGEQCDDGNTVDGDGCDGNCTRSACGNGVRTGEERCDDGDNVDGDGCDHSCLPTGCGNSVVTAGEECDDGNNVDGDGCDRGCQVSRCGNAITTGLEQCDDGNDVDGDGCEHDCSRTRVKRPLPGVVLSVVSGAGVVVGGGLAWFGTTPLGTHAEALERLGDAEARYPQDPTGGLAAAADARADEASSRSDFSSWGLPSIIGGSALAIAGSIGLGLGVWMALNDTEIEGGLQ
ncbi:MAG: DUF4215 domain-containing protein [Deltaproteobacteria bacterium]|nr:DUF4215 domain-containing protein [Deltaproteobacteria bacterium]